PSTWPSPSTIRARSTRGGNLQAAGSSDLPNVVPEGRDPLVSFSCRGKVDPGRRRDDGLARPTACRQSIELRGSTLYRSIYAYIGVGVMRVRFAWTLPIAAAAILLITMGGRQTIGLFIAPLDEATGLGIVAISLAVAIGQLVWGFAQPVFGGFADRFGPGRVIVIGGVMLAAGLALTPFVHSEWALIATRGLLSAFGAGAGSLSILIGAVSQRLAPEQRSFAAGFVNAGGSLG